MDEDLKKFLIKAAVVIGAVIIILVLGDALDVFNSEPRGTPRDYQENNNERQDFEDTTGNHCY